MSLPANDTTRLWLDSGEPLVLGEPLAGVTGEGAVYGVSGRPDLAAKVFHPTLTDLQAKLDKVAAMVQSPPPGAVQADGLVVLTWPQHLLVGDRGPVGYVMPRIGTATSVELHTMSNPSDRLQPMSSQAQWTRNATWEHLVNVAVNLCRAMEAVHRTKAVIGDFQERNILVYDTTQVTLVDCDSMQFTDRGGRQFLCAVGRPEFTAPELAGVNLRERARERPSDLFALAVHIHQLLMAGNHPFQRGEWTGAGEKPDALTLASSGDWAGGPGSQLRTHPLAPPVTYLPHEIRQLFTRAFTEGAQQPAARPSAAEWRSALTRVRYASCPRAGHQVPVGCTACPWCAIDQERLERKQRQAWRPDGSTGPQPIPPEHSGPGRVVDPQAGTGPMRPRPPTPPPNSMPDKIFGMSHQRYLVVLFTVVLVVVALATFIVWALLSGASTFGAQGVGAFYSGTPPLPRSTVLTAVP